MTTSADETASDETEKGLSLPGRPLSLRLIPWLLLGAALLFAYLTRGILLPFIAGFALAYLADPLADKLEDWGFGRGIAAGLIIVFFFLLVVGGTLAVWPLLQAQLIGLIKSLPAVIDAARGRIDLLLADLSRELGGELGREARGVLSSALEQGLGAAQKVLSRAFAGGLAIFNFLTLLLITPMVAFYLLRDYDRIVARVDGLLPQAHAPLIRETLKDIDKVLSGFVRGQLSVMAVMAVLYAAGWTAIGLDYGLILGLVAGLLGIIPFIGMVFAAIIALAVGFGQWGADWINLGLVAGVWIVVQVLESSVLTPRLLGREVGLHPVWVLFAVFAGGEIAGFVGVLVAVPAAAVIAVLVRASFARYRKGNGVSRKDGLSDDRHVKE